VQAEEVAYDEAAKRCGGNLPDYIPKDSVPRIVNMASDVGCPCGGTHVHDIAEIKSMTITGIRVKKGVTRISYKIDGC
ncbi:hypothetical protein CYMTET_30039, partial [Cymbomonas tetramitiformis]